MAVIDAKKQVGCFLNPSSIFKHLSENELDDVTFQREPDFYKRGTILFEEGNRIKGVFLVQSGVVKMYKTGIDGKEQIIRFAKKGDIMGFRSVIAQESACTSAKTLEDSTICYLPSENLIHYVKTNGSFALELLKLTCKELGEANDYITDIAQKSVRERLAEVLLHIKSDFDVDHQGILKLALTREELANIVGTATESVIRLLSEFRQEALIELHGRRIRIMDEKRLIQLAGM
ncbi:MAG: cyclic nucleotide-binding domain-containing protein [Bacteroidetes bacterium]|jgi:CRP-like cAMP-binding protein|nr:cyclic nucleotide-binding domain-containing protein [Bacteroidota bacterium]